MTGSYRAHAPLLRSLLLYRLTHRDARFRNQSERLDREAFALYGRLMEERRGEISHPLREEAAKFALLAVTLVLQGMVLAGRERFDRHAPPPEQLGAELTRLFLGYLGPHEPPVKRRRVRTL
jgi:hypothetical protein